MTSVTFTTDILHSQLSLSKLSSIVEDLLSQRKKTVSDQIFVNNFIELKQLVGPHDYPANEGDFFGNKNQPAGLIIDQSKKRRVLIYYIGGITYGEIAAIRFLNKLFTDRKFIIATTQIINGDACVEMLRGNINNRLNPASLL